MRKRHSTWECLCTEAIPPAANSAPASTQSVGIEHHTARGRTRIGSGADFAVSTARRGYPLAVEAPGKHRGVPGGVDCAAISVARLKPGTMAAGWPLRLKM